MTTTAVRARTALLVLACLTMTPAHAASAQDRTPTPSAKELWDAYPLRPSPTPGPERSGVSSPTGSGTARQPADRAPATSEPTAPIVLLAVLGFVAALGVLALPRLRRRRENPPAAARRSNGQAPEPDPGVSPSALVPPDRHRKWSATIEWHQTDAASSFRVVARSGRGTPEVVLADSGPVEWPPTTSASVQALGAVAAKLETSLVAAGWKAIRPGREWYAKRFSWEPVGQGPSRSPAARQPGSSRFARRVG
jgi:hypothetical protein